VWTAIVSGGTLRVAGVVATAAWLRHFWSYDARTDEHAIHERESRTAAQPHHPARRPLARLAGARPGPTFAWLTR